MTEKYERLTDSQWAAISEEFDINRKRSLDLRDILDALYYILRSGCQWRNLPAEFPAWTAVYYYFDKWKKDLTLQNINDRLNQLDREREHREVFPSVLCADTQSVKLHPMIFEDRGFDANKKINGRKRQNLVDTGGRLWRVKVHAANIHDGVGASSLLDNLEGMDSRLKKILGDDAYKGQFAEKVAQKNMTFECASRPPTEKGFVPIAQRWVVERTIAWSNFFRRIVKDYEYAVQSSETWLILANSYIMLRRIRDVNRI
ncbi:MAG: IS5 family transposase [Saprospiraceae bacterium]|nr:IS5 family transposase [Saprospiraceae bacterium]